MTSLSFFRVRARVRHARPLRAPSRSFRKRSRRLPRYSATTRGATGRTRRELTERSPRCCGRRRDVARLAQDGGGLPAPWLVTAWASIPRWCVRCTRFPDGRGPCSSRSRCGGAGGAGAMAVILGTTMQKSKPPAGAAQGETYRPRISTRCIAGTAGAVDRAIESRRRRCEALSSCR